MNLKQIKNLFYSTKSKSIGALVLNIFLGINQGASLLILIPLIEFLNTKNTEGLAVVSFFNFLGLEPTLFSFLLLFVLLTIVYALLRFFTHKLDTTISSQITRELKNEVFQSLLSSEWSFYKQKKRSEVSNILISEVDYVGFGVTRLLMGLGNTVLLIVYTAISFYISVPMTLLAMLCFLPFIWVQKRFVKKRLAIGEEVYKQGEKYFKTVLEFLSSFKLSKIFQWKSYFTFYYQKETSKVEQKSMELTLNSLYLGFVYEVGLVLIICFALFVSYEWLEMTFEKLVALLIIASRLIPNIRGLSSNYQSFVGMIPSYSKILDLIKSCKENKENDKDNSEGLDFMSFKEVKFENVSFAYEKSSPVFEGFDLQINRRDLIGIAGTSGAGKSTFLDLLMGLSEPDAGTVSIDGIVLDNSSLLSWRKQISYVSQESFLFNTSIRKNIQMSLDADDLESFISNFPWLNFISKLPQGLETEIGDLGKFLSGGERQRICIARALYKKSNLLILDEATNSLDQENEKMILDELNSLKSEMTIVLVSHDAGVLDAVDRVIRLNE